MGDLGNTLGAFIASLLLGRQRTGRVGSGLAGGGGPGISAAPAGEPVERRSAMYEDEGVNIAALPDRFRLPPLMADAILQICHERGTCDRFGGADMTLALAPMLLGISNSAPAVEEEEASEGGSSAMRWRDITAMFQTFNGVITGDTLEHDILVGNLQHAQGIFYLVQLWGINTAVGGTNVATARFKRQDLTTVWPLTFSVTIGNSIENYLAQMMMIHAAEEQAFNSLWGEWHRTSDATGGTNQSIQGFGYQGHPHVPGLEPFAPSPGNVPFTLTLANSLAASSFNVQALRIYVLK